MKKFSELTVEKQIELLKRDKKLREKFDNYVQDCEMDWLTEKLHCITPYLSDWSLGFWNHNFISVKDYDGIIDGIDKSVYCYGSTPELEKLLAMCKKLRDRCSNLFEYHAKRLVEMFYQQELVMIVNYTENVCYKICSEDFNDAEVDGYIEPFFYNLSEYLLDEENNKYYKPCAIVA